jgi:hypothetical protein
MRAQRRCTPASRIGSRDEREDSYAGQSGVCSKTPADSLGEQGAYEGTTPQGLPALFGGAQLGTTKDTAQRQPIDKLVSEAALPASWGANESNASHVQRRLQREDRAIAGVSP